MRLTNSKGGVGKTSIAVHLAAWLVGKRRPVAFIDADPQQSASSWIKDLATDVRLEQIGDGDELVHRIPEIAAEVDDVVIDGPAGLTATTRAICPGRSRLTFHAVPRYSTAGSRKGGATAAGSSKLPSEASDRRTDSQQIAEARTVSREMLALLRKHQIPLLAGLSHRQAFADAAGQGQIVMDMGPPALLAALEMKQLLKEITRG